MEIPKQKIQGKIKTKITAPNFQKEKQIKRKGKKEKYTNLLITISTNYKPINENDYEEKAEEFSEILENFFQPDTMHENFMDFIKPNENDNWDSETILNVNVRSVIEHGKGKMGGRIHSHTILEITHKSKLWVNVEKIKKHMDNNLSFVKGVYVNVRLVPEGLKYILQYVKKDEEEEELSESEEEKQLTQAIHDLAL